MDINIIAIYGTTLVLPVAASIFSVIIGIFIKKYFDRTMDKLIKKGELILNTQFETMRDKTKLYWLIYFKLLRSLSTKSLIDKIKENNLDPSNLISLELDILIPTLESVVTLINENVHMMDIDDEFLELILRFISHVIAFRCIKKLGINGKPSEYGFPFPDEFTLEIKRRTLLIQEEYENFIDIHNKKDKGTKLFSLKKLITDIPKISDDFEEKLRNEIIDVLDMQLPSSPTLSKTVEGNVNGTTVIIKNS